MEATQEQELPQETEGAVETTEEAALENGKPAGYYPVDTSNLPEDIQKPVEERFDYLYRQVKQNDRTLQEYRRVASEQSKIIAELTNGVGAVVNHLQDKAFTDTEATLTQKMNSAFEGGDTKGYQDAQAKLIELQVEKKFASKQRQVPQKQEAPDPVKQAVAEGNLSQEEAYTIDAWQSEAREGMPLRPWATIGHPDYERAYAETIAVMSNRNLASVSMKEKLEEVDRRMGLKNTTKNTVMGGNLTNNRKNNKITLSAEAQKIAIRTKFAGPGKSDSEHLAAYLKQIQKSQTTKRGS